MLNESKSKLSSVCGDGSPRICQRRGLRKGGLRYLKNCEAKRAIIGETQDWERVGPLRGYLYHVSYKVNHGRLEAKEQCKRRQLVHQERSIHDATEM